ncbi:DUF835 domain-containing protein [Thermococcus sp.]|uniref:DUF835 domain-containing protein n=1 Tax=Thermococcus sp. TaxID=35749 RepID=UPI00261E25D9|nr:DUF835 domain-containing protein [Thermococcus sp.]
MDSLLVTGQTFSLSAKLIVAGFLIRAYKISKRRSALYLGIAWIVSALVVFMDFLGNEILIVTLYALFSSILFYGSLLFLIEEGQASLRMPWILSPPPLVGTLYGILLGTEWESRVGIPYGISAFYVFLAGSILALTEFEFPTARKAGIALALFGLHEMDYPVLRSVEWFAPFGFALGAVLTVLSAYFMAKMVLSESFIKKKPKIKVEPGIKIITSEDYKAVANSLKEYPVLAFLRKPVEFPSWTVYMITSISGEMKIHPTNLARISEIVSRYLQEANSSGITGVVILDGLEFLVTYNGLQPVLKFLATLRDMAFVNNALLVVVLDEGSWDERERAMLRRIFE